MPRNQEKQTPAPDTYNLHQIEAWSKRISFLSMHAAGRPANVSCHPGRRCFTVASAHRERVGFVAYCDARALENALVAFDVAELITSVMLPPKPHN